LSCRRGLPICLIPLLIWPNVAGAELRVWAVDESVRIDPVTISVIEQRSFVAGQGPSRQYLDRNPVFDGNRRSIELQGARNETLAFQVIVAPEPERVEELYVELPRLQGPIELVRGREISLFRQWYVDVKTPSTHEKAQDVTNLLDDWFPVSSYKVKLVTSCGPGWYPDPLIPLDGPLAVRLPGLPMSLPSEENPIPGQRAQGFWIDIWVPPDAPEGEYRGDLVVTADGERRVLAVRLVVLPVTLPEEFNGGIGSISYDFVGGHLIHHSPGAVHDFYRMMHRHRLTLDALYLHPEWEAGRIDWSHYDELVGPLLDGRAFTDEAGYRGPGKGRPVSRFLLPLDWNWPVKQGSQGFDEVFRRTLRSVEDHILEKGWTRTEWSLFINITDEPRSPEDFALIQHYGELLGSAELRHPELFKYRIDAGPFKSIHTVIPGWDVDRIFEEVGGVVDIWNCAGGYLFCPSQALNERFHRNPNEQAWFYFSNAAGEPAVGSLLIDGEALGPRTWGWIVWRYGFSAGVSWEIGWPSPRCLNEPDCSGYGLQGDASLVYLADFLGAEAVVLPSIRLKNLRRGAEDYEYLRLLAASGRPDLADAFAIRLVPRALDDRLAPRMRGAWEHDPADWEEIRREMGAVLAGRVRQPDIEALISAAPMPVRPSIGITRRASLVAGFLLVLILLAFVVLTEQRGHRRGGA
jgi:hypothetical protein